LVLDELRARGLIEASGLAAIERAKANGSWERFDLAESLTITPELAHVFASDKDFARAWDQLTESIKRQFLHQIYDAKTDATRTRRIESVRQSICS